jgi:hypothetical protein
MLYQFRLKSALSILILMPVVLAACAPAISPIVQPGIATPLSPTMVSTQENSKTTPHTLSPLLLKPTPIIIATSTPNEDPRSQKTMTPINDQNSTENPLLSYAKNDLAQRLGIPLEQIELVSMEEVTWPDASLGCPQPGMLYKQVQVDGTLIRLDVAGKVYEYHSGGVTDPFLCEDKLSVSKPLITLDIKPSADNPHPETPNVFPLLNIKTPIEGTATELISPDQYPEMVISAVIEDLSQRLNVRNEEIYLLANGYTETQSVAPCGLTMIDEETSPSGEGITLGYEVLLKVGNNNYRYIAIGGLGYYCGKF